MVNCIQYTQCTQCGEDRVLDCIGLCHECWQANRDEVQTDLTSHSHLQSSFIMTDSAETPEAMATALTSLCAPAHSPVVHYSRTVGLLDGLLRHVPHATTIVCRPINPEPSGSPCRLDITCYHRPDQPRPYWIVRALVPGQSHQPHRTGRLLLTLALNTDYRTAYTVATAFLAARSPKAQQLDDLRDAIDSLTT